jgi:hypothetical protein
MADREQTETNGQADPSDALTLGNRPATGARLVDSATPLTGAFGGGQEATDFLGLSQELTGLPAGALPEGEPTTLNPASESSPEADPSASWLLSLDENRENPAEEEEEISASFEDGAGGEEHLSRRLWKIAAAVMIVGAGVTVAVKLSSRSSPSALTEQFAHMPAGAKPPAHKPTELASTPVDDGSRRHSPLPGGETSGEPAVVADPAVAATQVMAQPAETTPAVEAGPESSEPSASVAAVENPALSDAGADSPITPRLGEQRLVQWMNEHGWSTRTSPEDGESGAQDPGSASTSHGTRVPALVALGSSPPSALPAADPVATSSPLPRMDGGDALTAPAPDRVVLGGSSTPGGLSGKTVPGAAPLGALRLATQEDLAGVWDGNAIPMEALDAESRLLTPTVGRVRVLFKTGEIFEGRLYAIGQGQVWLENDLGRLALYGERIQKINQTSSEGDAKTLQGLPRMRVRTPGGLFFGKVVARDEHHVTLVTEEGARLTLESTDVEPAPLGDTRVIGPVKP